LTDGSDGPGSERRNGSLNLSWTTSQAPPKIYLLGPSFAPQVDTSTTRVTNWDYQGRLTDKQVKGILFEVDTGGVTKTLAVQADGSTITTITVNANGQQAVQVSFPQFKGRLLRLWPQDTVPWKLYQFRWIFDEEPLALTRWETQPTNHGQAGYQTVLYGHVTLISTGVVTLAITAFQEGGASATSNYSIPSTGGAKQTIFVPFNGTKGILFKYLFTSVAPHTLYREESSVQIIPWGYPTSIQVKPFGDDDIDGSRDMRDAGLVSARSGGAGGV